MAFADLTPREADQVATVIAGLHGGEKVGALHRPEITEAEVLAAVRVNALVEKALDEDGLGSWIETTDSQLQSGSGHRAAMAPPRSAAERIAPDATIGAVRCAAGRGATRRRATSSTTGDGFSVSVEPTPEECS